MSVMPVADQAPPEQSVEDKIASRFGETPQEQPAEEAAPAEDLWELDYEGEKYQLPAKLKTGFMQNKDYTQKTQELAEQRKTYEHSSELAKSAQLERAFYESIGSEQQELSVIDAYLAQMSKADWSSMDTGTVLKTKIELDNIKERKASLKESIADKRTKFDADVKSRMQELRGKARELASKSISGFGEDTEKSIRAYAASEGLTDAEFENVALDPRSLRVLYKAAQYEKVQAAAKNPVSTKPGVLKPGPTTERMPPDVVSKLNFNKAMQKARTNRDKSDLIEERLTSMFSKRK
jgi:hypothetical protein